MRAALVALAVLRFGLKLELGPEFDSNANRAEVYLNPPRTPPGDSPPPAPVGSFLLRLAGTGTMRHSAGPNTLRLALTLGGKTFAEKDAEPQDVVVVQAAVDDTLRAGNRLLLGLGGDYYDATQPFRCPELVSGGQPVDDTSCHRDFRSGGARLSGSLVDGDYDLTLAAGVRAFGWKPDGALSFDGLWASAAFGAHLRTGLPEDESEWDVTTSGRLESRYYHGPMLLTPDDTGADGGARRQDVDALWNVSISYVGPLLAAASYTLDFNRSSNLGQSFLRQILTMKLAFDLPGKVTATAKVQLVFTHYPEPAALTGGMLIPLSIEDENRDAVVVDLERPIGAGFAAGARYSIYRNSASGSTLGYLRQVAYLGVSYKYR